MSQTVPETVELHRLTVPARIDDALRTLSDTTGASLSWHRRRALVEYLTKHGQLTEDEVPGLMSARLVGRSAR